MFSLYLIMTWLKNLVICWSTLVFLSSCRLDNPEWDTGWALPLAWSDLTPANIFGDTLIAYDPLGQVYLSYDREVFKLPIDTLLIVPDTGFSYGLTLPGSITIYPGNPLTVYDNYTIFQVPDFSLNQLVVGSGTVQILAETQAQARVRVTYSAPKASKNGVTFTLTDTINPASPGQTSILEREIDLSGYVFDLTGDDHLQANRLRIRITAEVPPGDPPIPVPAGTLLVNTRLTFKNIKPYFARGSIMTRKFQLQADTQKVPLFGLVKAGNFSMTEPWVKIILENGVGADLQAKIEQIEGINSRTGQSVLLSAPITQGNVLLGRALNSPFNGMPYKPTYFESVADGQNSNLRQFIENMPDKIILKSSATLNPIAFVGAGHDFVYNISKTSARLQVWFPLGFSFNQLVLADTVPYDPSSLPYTDRFRRLVIKVLCENTYPFDLYAQLYVLNDHGQILDSLLNVNVVPAAALSLNGNPNTPVQSILQGVLEGNRKELFLKGRRLWWKIYFHSHSQGQVPVFYDFYKLRARLVVQAEVRI